MDEQFRHRVERFVEAEVSHFHTRRAENVGLLNIRDVLRAKNPYLFRAKNLGSAPDFVKALLDARLSSAEEGLFGKFMEELAVFVSKEKCSGRSSSTAGIDIEMEREGVLYLIAVKSGRVWGSKAQREQQNRDFANAVSVLKQKRHVGEVQPTLGICYGRFQKKYTGHYLHIGGRNFWELISGEPNLYMEIVEPVGYRAKELNDAFYEARDRAINRMARDFANEYCMPDGAIDWPKIVAEVSDNIEPGTKKRSRLRR